MDLVTNDSDIVLSADFRIGMQLLYCPHTAHGVVGGAEDSRLYLVGFNFFFQISKINFIMAVFKNKGTVNEFPVILRDGGMERVVNGLIDEDASFSFVRAFTAMLMAGTTPGVLMSHSGRISQLKCFFSQPASARK